MIRNGTRQRKYAAVPRAHPSGRSVGRQRCSTTVRECAKRRPWRNKPPYPRYRNRLCHESIAIRVRTKWFIRAPCTQPTLPPTVRYATCDDGFLLLHIPTTKRIRPTMYVCSDCSGDSSESSRNGVAPPCAIRTVSSFRF